MAHYARVTEGSVTNVIVADETFFESFVDDVAGEWIKTSYNTRGNVHRDPESKIPDGGTPLRGNFASIGMLYDYELDVFIDKKPYPSFVMNTDTYLWEAPVAYPDDGETYIWDETTTSWVVNS